MWIGFDSRAILDVHDPESRDSGQWMAWTLGKAIKSNDYRTEGTLERPTGPVVTVPWTQLHAPRSPTFNPGLRKRDGATKAMPHVSRKQNVRLGNIESRFYARIDIRNVTVKCTV